MRTEPTTQGGTGVSQVGVAGADLVYYLSLVQVFIQWMNGNGYIRNMAIKAILSLSISNEPKYTFPMT
jgi:hypothetical protein